MDFHRMVLTALAAELEAQRSAGDVHVPVAQGGEAEGVVLLRIFGVANEDQRRFEEIHNGGENLLPRQAAPRKILVYPLAELRQRLAKGAEACKFGLVAYASPAGVIAVLLTASSVAAGGLEVTVGPLADPDVRPRRRDRQLLDALDHLAVLDRFPLWIEKRKPLACLATANAGLVVGDVAQARDLGALHRVVDDRDGLNGCGHSHQCRLIQRRLQDLQRV